MSCAWLLATPSPDTYMSGPVFQEATATHLFLPLRYAARVTVGKPTRHGRPLAAGEDALTLPAPQSPTRPVSGPPTEYLAE